MSAGLEVAIEVVKAKRDPNNPDTDGDGLWDGDEYFGDKEGLYQLALQNVVWVWTSSGVNYTKFIYHSVRWKEISQESRVFLG